MRKIPQQEIEQLLSGVNGTFGLYIEDLSSGEIFKHNPEHVFPAASVIKIPMLALLLRDVAEGRVEWEKPHPITPSNRVGGTGILCELDEYYQPTVATMAKLMIVLSDNTATNEIMDIIGLDRFAAFCEEMGLNQTRLMRKMLDFEAIRQGKNNYISAQDAGNLLSRIAKGTFVSPEISQTIISIMEKQQCRNKLPALLPAVPSWASEEDRRNLKPNTVLVANKTGDLTNIQHDVGIFTLPGGRRYIIAAFSEKLSSDAAGIEAVAKLSQLVYYAQSQT